MKKRAIVILKRFENPDAIFGDEDFEIEQRIEGLIIELNSTGVIVAPFHANKNRDVNFVFAPLFYPMSEIDHISFLDLFVC